MKDTFLTIAADSEGVYKDKGSKFLAFAYPVDNEEVIKEKIAALRKKYFDARHHCYAWRLGTEGMLYRANDDGEPSNSAGKPILGQIDSYGLTNVLVVVVRYFGGILLGVGGLIQAYKHAAADALTNARTVPGIVTEVYRFTFEYPDMNQIIKVTKDMGLECFSQDFNMACSMKVRVRKSQTEQMMQRLELIGSLKITPEN
ncbi:MAG: YigZ family protein [Bacteroidales bacterium]|nr:YigZ family protein [Bacteroidales bacterium]